MLEVRDKIAISKCYAYTTKLLLWILAGLIILSWIGFSVLAKKSIYDTFISVVNVTGFTVGVMPFIIDLIVKKRY